MQTSRQPLRVLVDSRLEVDPAAHIFDGEGPVLVACTVSLRARNKAAKLAALKHRGAEILQVAEDSAKPARLISKH